MTYTGSSEDMLAAFECFKCSEMLWIRSCEVVCAVATEEMLFVRERCVEKRLLMGSLTLWWGLVGGQRGSG